MALRKLGQDPESPDGKSPTLYVDDEKGTYLVQGWKVIDEARRSQPDLPGHEDVIEIPKRRRCRPRRGEGRAMIREPVWTPELPFCPPAAS